TRAPTTRPAPWPASKPGRRHPPKPPSSRARPMLDIKLIRDQPDAVATALADKGGAELIHEILARDTDRRRLIKEVEDLKALRNKASEAIGQAKRRGEDASAEQARMREVGDRVKTLDAEVKVVDE